MATTICCPRCEFHIKLAERSVPPPPRIQVKKTEDILAQFQLTPKEFQIAILMSEGLLTREVAKQVGTTQQVVKNYARVIYRKVGVTNRLFFVMKVEEERYGG